MTYNKELITFRKENQTVYTVTSNKNAKCYVDDEEIQDEDRITTYFYKSNTAFTKFFDGKEILNFIEKVKQTYKSLLKMINFDNVRGQTKKRNPNWLQVTNHSYIILIIGGPGSGK